MTDRDDAEILRGIHADETYEDLDLMEVRSAGSAFDGCRFRRVRLNASVHVGSAFVNCTFVQCDFFDASFLACKLVGSSFERCTFPLLKVDDGDWSFVSLVKADLRGVRFTGVRMREADLTGAQGQDSAFRDVDLSGAALHNASFAGADLCGTDLSTIDPRTVDFAGAKIRWQQAVQLASGLGLDVTAD